MGLSHWSTSNALGPAIRENCMIAAKKTQVMKGAASRQLGLNRNNLKGSSLSRIFNFPHPFVIVNLESVCADYSLVFIDKPTLMDML